MKKKKIKTQLLEYVRELNTETRKKLKKRKTFYPMKKKCVQKKSKFDQKFDANKSVSCKLRTESCEQKEKKRKRCKTVHLPVSHCFKIGKCVTLIAFGHKKF